MGQKYIVHWLEEHPTEEDAQWKEMLPPTAEITGTYPDGMTEWEIVEGFEAANIEEAQKIVDDLTDAEVYTVYRENPDGSQEFVFNEDVVGGE